MEHYELRDGRRRAIPYAFSYSSHCKRRWIGRPVFEVMQHEFPHTCTPDYLRAASTNGRLLVNGTPVEERTVFRDGDQLLHTVWRTEPDVPYDGPLEVLLCRPWLVGINKPAGLPVHAAGRFHRNTCVEVLRTERPELSEEGSGLHVLHRLDRQVSGVLLLPRSPAVAAELGVALASRRMRKQYIARVRGRFPDGTCTVREPIRMTTSSGATTCDCHASGKAAETDCRHLGYDESSDTSLVLCEPLTGRSHQIRLHLRHLGHPIANDPVYGASGAPPPQKDGCSEEFEVLWLHAWSYRLDDDALGFFIRAPPPEWARLPLPALDELLGSQS